MALGKNLRMMEERIEDEREAHEKTARECDKAKLKNELSKKEIEKAFLEMENYAKILETLEHKVRIVTNEKDKAIEEKNRALGEL